MSDPSPADRQTVQPSPQTAFQQSMIGAIALLAIDVAALYALQVCLGRASWLPDWAPWIALPAIFAFFGLADRLRRPVERRIARLATIDNLPAASEDQFRREIDARSYRWTSTLFLIIAFYAFASFIIAEDFGRELWLPMSAADLILVIACPLMLGRDVVLLSTAWRGQSRHP